MTRTQLLALGFTLSAIRRRMENGRLHQVMRGVYAVGRPELGRHGVWSAAVLSCGPGAVLSHGSAAALWGIGRERATEIEISIPTVSRRRRAGIRIHRRPSVAPTDLTDRHGIPVTRPVRTLLDLAAWLEPPALESAVNAADRLGVIEVGALRAALDPRGGEAGVGRLRRMLDRQTFRLTDSELERRFLRLVEEAGLTPLRFTHAQVRYAPGQVRATLTAVARRLGACPLTSST